MLCEDIKEKLAIGYADLILVIDTDGLAAKCDIQALVTEAGYEFISYADPLTFRYYYEKKLRNSDHKKVLVLVKAPEQFLPYDIRKRFYVVELEYSTFFYNLDEVALRESSSPDHNLLYIAYQNHFGGKLNYNQTVQFIQNTLYDQNNVKQYIAVLRSGIKQLLALPLSYQEWFKISVLWAKFSNLINAGYSNIEVQSLFREVNVLFKSWMLDNYKSLSSNPLAAGPVMVHRINDYISAKSKKAALVVVDGMSIGDWLFIKPTIEHLAEIKETYTFALVPSITSVSRKAIFSGRLPANQPNLFSLSDEKKLWVAYWKDNGYQENDIFYGRGFSVELPYNTRIAGIIINAVDDTMHGQVFGGEGMNLSVSLFAKKGELKALVDRLLQTGFDIYLTSDHGNMEAVGIGKVTNEGLNTETTSQRARVYKDFADTEKIRNIPGVFQYPGYYLPKDFSYYLCDENLAFVEKGKTIICHGGMTVNEVIVPFIEIRSSNNE